MSTAEIRSGTAGRSSGTRPMTASTQEGPPRSLPHVVVIGDVVLDRELTGQVNRISPDAPVPVLDVTSVRQTPGAAGLTAVLAATSGARVTLIAPIGDDPAATALSELLERYVDLIGMGHLGPTRRKTRLRSGGQSLLRMDDGGPGTPTKPDAERLRGVLRSADAILVSDYGAGTTADPVIRELLTQAATSTWVVWDPHRNGGAPVPGCAMVTPNLAEASAALSKPIGRTGAEQPDRLAAQLRARWQARSVAVTAGPLGAFLATADGQTHYLPSDEVAGADPCGAGDRFSASAAVALARGALPTEAAAAAVLDASNWVRSGGSAASRLFDGVGDAAAVVNKAAMPTEQRSLTELARALRGGSGTLVATGGCFDIVHAGHVATLQAARRLGTSLVVLINSDASVSRLKGPGRPVVNEQDRARVLQAFDCVDAVHIFDGDDPTLPLAELRHDIWVKGGDYGGTELPEAAAVEAAGGRVVLLPYLSGRSTSNIIERSRRPISSHS
jgi:D-beta-D-heptose 7-phosphate kinase/D-beta-D-heptose 1-phosphate adenosyltransferase